MLLTLASIPLGSHGHYGHELIIAYLRLYFTSDTLKACRICAWSE